MVYVSWLYCTGGVLLRCALCVPSIDQRAMVRLIDDECARRTCIYISNTHFTSKTAEPNVHVTLPFPSSASIQSVITGLTNPYPVITNEAPQSHQTPAPEYLPRLSIKIPLGTRKHKGSNEPLDPPLDSRIPHRSTSLLSSPPTATTTATIPRT